MITENEKEKIKQIRDMFLSNAFQIYGQEIPEELQAEFVGKNMANLDALFAIREGEAWRGMTDPQEIARTVLREGHIGE
jgi:hypothetical protein